MTTPENPPAFPLATGNYVHEKGMTLRDWFAGQLAPLTFGANYGNDWGKSGVDHGPRAAKRAYAWADAMLEARKP